MSNNKFQINLVIGYPLQHSQSPLLHNAVYEILNYNAVMFPYSNQDLSATIKLIKKIPAKLIAVTMPFKQVILPYLDHMSAAVSELKVANTVLYKNNKLYGFNTDIDGIAYALRNISLSGKNVLIIGAGGAASAAAYYLKNNQANLFWLNRTKQRAVDLMKIFGGQLVDLNNLNPNNLNQFPIDVFINTTPLGMLPEINKSPLPDYSFKKTQIVFDMIYNPVDTCLLTQAKLHGAVCISGLDMFVGQGLKQIEILCEDSIITPELINLIKNNLKKSQAII